MRRFLIFDVMALGVLAAHAIPFEEARREALFLTDKMAYELNVNEAQYEALYEINLDYFMSLSSSRDVKGTHLNRRNYDINCVLTPMQYSKFYKADYFYTPAKWDAGVVLKVYTRYPDRSKMYRKAPYSYSVYRGSHSWANNGNKSWYKGKDFKSDKAVRSFGNRTLFPKSGSHATPKGHGTRSGHTTGIGQGVSVGSGVTIGNGAKPAKSNGIGNGVTIGNGAGTGSGTGIGQGVVTVKETRRNKPEMKAARSTSYTAYRRNTIYNRTLLLRIKNHKHLMT